jgi:hypothetical protein
VKYTDRQSGLTILPLRRCCAGRSGLSRGLAVAAMKVATM